MSFDLQVGVDFRVQNQVGLRAPQWVPIPTRTHAIGYG